jgi:hypothetical protein
MRWLLAIIVTIVPLSLAGYWYSLAVPGRSHTGSLPPVTVDETQLAARMRRHIETIASTPHNVEHYANLQAAAAYIEHTLRGFGYEPVSQQFTVDGVSVRNIEVVIEPTDRGSQVRTWVVGAHCDSAYDAPGANDNGSGSAAVIELARLLKDHRPRTTRIRLVLFVNEEPPYFQTEDMGSLRYAAMLAERKEPVAAMISLETIGYYSDKAGGQGYPPPFGLVLPSKGDFVSFVGMPGSRDFVHEVIASFRRETAFPSIGGVAPGFIPGIDWSDHWSFAEHGFKALMVTDTAIFRYPHYHTRQDTPDKLDYERLARVTKGIEHVVRELAR